MQHARQSTQIQRSKRCVGADPADLRQKSAAAVRQTMKAVAPVVSQSGGPKPHRRQNRNKWHNKPYRAAAKQPAKEPLYAMLHESRAISMWQREAIPPIAGQTEKSICRGRT